MSTLDRLAWVLAMLAALAVLFARFGAAEAATTAAATTAAAATARPAVLLPRQPAPLGLSFGMRPDEVALPVVVAPAPLGTARSAQASVPAGASPAAPVSAPRPLFAAGAPAGSGLPPAPPRPVVEPAARGALVDGLGDYIRACEAAFDRISGLGAGDQDWLAWRASHLRGGEASDFTADVADRAGLAVAPASTIATEADGRRSAGLYRFDAADGRRVVCLLFTADGLAQVFLAGVGLDGLRDGIIARLDRQSGLVDFALDREAARFALSLGRPACGLYCRLLGERTLVERRLWLDPHSRVLVATKRGVVFSGLGAVFAGSGAQREVFDGLPDSFVASVDLGRRASVLRQPLAAATTRSSAAPAARFVPAPAGVSREELIESFVP